MDILIIRNCFCFVVQEFERSLPRRNTGTWACKPCSHKVYVSNCTLLSSSDFFLFILFLDLVVTAKMLQYFAEQFLIWHHSRIIYWSERVGGLGFGIQQLQWTYSKGSWEQFLTSNLVGWCFWTVQFCFVKFYNSLSTKIKNRIYLFVLNSFFCSLLDNNGLLGGFSPEITRLMMLSEYQVDENQLASTAKASSCTERPISWYITNQSMKKVANLGCNYYPYSMFWPFLAIMKLS